MPGIQGKTPKRLSIDFSGVERGGGGRNPHVNEGDYLMRIVGCTLRSKRDDPSRKHLAWEAIFERALPGNENAVGKKYTHRTGLSQESLWSLRGLLIDMLGEDKVPQSAVDVPIAAIVAKKPLVGMTFVDDEYDGKPTSKVAGTFSKTDWKDLVANAAAADEDEEEEEEEEEEEDEEEEDEEEEEEEEEAPAPKKKSTKAAPAKKTKKPVVEDDDDEDELELDDL